MFWTGKVVGSLLGMATGLGAVGAAVGVVIGHGVDERRAAGRARRKLAEQAPDPVAIQQVFFRSTFEVMGHVARSRGRITEQNIAAAKEIFRQFGLDRQAMRYAIDCFRVGKQPGYPLRRALAELRHTCDGRRDLLRAFVEVQLRGALLGHSLRGRTRALLLAIADQLGVSPLEFARLETLLRLQGYGERRAGGEQRPSGRQDDLQAAYEALEVSPAASDAEVKQAYRRQMSQNHPDKLVARGLPESMLEVAKQRTQAIAQAYERVRVARGMR
ncbi:MAG: co-chaperone DjlA [Steroidobacteraceae bacterium]